ncbi:hypothetical protein [Rhodococcoides yunnanense]|uniref:FHA domain-containing protein n=1 Tax=Rhodococcoides yunnanense TaxID=278209 RepID=A0ABU4BKC6_9NOCA|nr:hypothetical protein [Rhodococcus yunnanensis]MDV6264665.1 hypothetical protein [Rhodococcus yunnanensis]
MATIGIAIESGSMQTILVEPTSGEVLADRTTPLHPDAATVLTEAIEIMRAEAATLDTDVDAVGVVYRSEAERAEFSGALGDEPVTLCSASESFLTWLAQSKELADAKTVLLYYMGEAGVSISLADAAEASFTPTRTAELDSMSPERIGSTIPLAWDVVDHSGKKPEFVALFGDSSSNRDLVDILALGLGVPVVRVGDADQIAARGAALLALADGPAPVGEAAASPAVAPVEPLSAESEPEQAAEPEEADAQDTVATLLLVTAVSASAVPTVADSKPSRAGSSGRKLVFAAVLLAGVLSAGVAVAATLPGDSESTAEQSVDQRDAGADLAGATRHVDPMTTTDPAALAAPAPAPLPETIPPTVDPATVATPTPTADAWATQDAQQAVVAPPPAPAPTKVDPPQFTVPAVVPEPGKSQAQLEQEAWDRHWQQTGEWIEQELAGG